MQPSSAASDNTPRACTWHSCPQQLPDSKIVFRPSHSLLTHTPAHTTPSVLLFCGSATQ